MAGGSCIVVCFQVVFFTASGDVELSKGFYQAFMCSGRGLVPTQAGSFGLRGSEGGVWISRIRMVDICSPNDR